jgi:hypothetical protein
MIRQQRASGKSSGESDELKNVNLSMSEKDRKDDRFLFRINELPRTGFLRIQSLRKHSAPELLSVGHEDERSD